MSGNPDTSAPYQAADARAGQREVEVLFRESDEISHPNCLVVEPSGRLNRDSAMHVTIEHYRRNPASDGFPWIIDSVVPEPLLLGEAIEIALAYAHQHDVPVILLNEDGFSSVAEKRQTNTQSIRIGNPKSR